MSHTFAIRERADRLRRLVFEAGEQFVELTDPQGVEEPFASKSLSALWLHHVVCNVKKLDVHIRAR